MDTKKTARYGLLIALAFLFSYIESVVMVPLPVPGIKLGLANLVVLAALYRMGNGPAALVSVVRVVLAGLTFNNAVMMLYSLAGCTLSLLVMILLKRTDRFGMAGVSVAGGTASGGGGRGGDLGAPVLSSGAPGVRLHRRDRDRRRGGRGGEAASDVVKFLFFAFPIYEKD